MRLLSTFVISAVSLVVQYYATKYKEDDFKVTLRELEKDAGLPRITTYDFIVVGGGAAGCTLAGRLSERYRVLLLEAGGTPVPTVDVPYFVPEVLHNKDINYFYKSVPQPHASQSTGGVITTISGKMLGGSGSHNGMVQNRGSPIDFDVYAKLLNDDSWSYKNVLRHFRKQENFIGYLFNTSNAGLKYYGDQGPITVDTVPSDLLPSWFNAARELKIPIADANGKQIESFTPVTKLVEKGQRVSSYTAYIKPHEENRGNLKVLRYSSVSEVLIDENKRAYGVTFKRHGIPQIAHASKEVVLSAGAFGSPLILLRSGIGPRNDLEAADIPVKVDIPGVGRKLIDHAAVTLGPFEVNSAAVPLLPRIRNETEFQSMLQEYITKRSGFFANNREGASEVAQAILISERAKSTPGEEDWPDLFLSLLQFYPKVAEGDELPTMGMFIMNGRMRSEGSLRLNVTAYKEGAEDDTELAVIDYNLLSNPSDVDLLVEGIKWTLKILENTEAFKVFETRLSPKPLDACRHHTFRSDEYWRCFVRNEGTSWFHMVGTCTMGVDSDPFAVTDSKMRVRGVSGLRVVDASVYPFVTNTNLHAPVLMLGEKAADEIFQQWNWEK